MNEHTQWCRNLFSTLSEGGAWGIPRSGLVFQKRGGMLVLVDQMPHVEAMPITPAQLAEQQQGDFDATKVEFGRAGVLVVRLHEVGQV